MIFDTHCHIYDEQYNDDINEVIDRAKEVGVDLFLVPSDSYKNMKKCLSLADLYESIYCAIGVHPSEIFNETKSLDEILVEMENYVINNKKIKAIGEIGLDYYWHKNEDEHEKQKLWFNKQISLANKLHLPIIVHSRDACKDTLDLLKNNIPLYGCVFHCFSYSKEVLKEVIDLGFYIGLDGPVTYKNALTPKEVASIVPLDRLLVETDCPYLTPVPNRGKRNEPKELTHIIFQIAQLRGITYDEVCLATYNNGRRFFNI